MKATEARKITDENTQCVYSEDKLSLEYCIHVIEQAAKKGHGATSVNRENITNAAYNNLKELGYRLNDDFDSLIEISW